MKIRSLLFKKAKGKLLLSSAVSVCPGVFYLLFSVVRWGWSGRKCWHPPVPRLPPDSVHEAYLPTLPPPQLQSLRSGAKVAENCCQERQGRWAEALSPPVHVPLSHGTSLIQYKCKENNDWEFYDDDHRELNPRVGPFLRAHPCVMTLPWGQPCEWPL